MYYSEDGEFTDDGSKQKSVGDFDGTYGERGEDIDEDDYISEFESLEDYSDGVGDNYDVGALNARGLYFNGAQIELKLGKDTYTFNGTAAAVYGYLLYKQAVALGPNTSNVPQKAEAAVKKQLEKEIKWTEVRAVAPGYVEEIGANGTSGFKVKLRHTVDGTKVTTTYCHMKRYPVVQVGQYVGAGSLLGYEGTTGKSGGYHTHMIVNVGGKNGNPTRYMYPFFAPFWYEEMAEDDNYDERSTYLTLERTIYPYKERSEITGSYTSEANKNRSMEDMAIESQTAAQESHPLTDGDGYVQIMNYLPQYPLLTDASNLADPETPIHDYYDLPMNVLRKANKTDYKEQLIANPDYADDEFITKVEENNNKIHGVPPSASIPKGKTMSTPGTDDDSGAGATP